MQLIVAAAVLSAGCGASGSLKGVRIRTRNPMTRCQSVRITRLFVGWGTTTTGLEYPCPLGSISKQRHAWSVQCDPLGIQGRNPAEAGFHLSGLV